MIVKKNVNSVLLKILKKLTIVFHSALASFIIVQFKSSTDFSYKDNQNIRSLKQLKTKYLLINLDSKFYKKMLTKFFIFIFTFI